jgi:hypothetical protein
MKSVPTKVTVVLKKFDWYISIYKNIMLQTPLFMQFIGRLSKRKKFYHHLFGDASRAADLDSELGLLLVGIGAGGGVDALVAVVVVPGAGVDVRVDVLELEDVLGLVGGVVDVGEQVLVLAGALDVVGGGGCAGAVVGVAVVVGDVEVVVAASGASKDELGDLKGILLLGAGGGGGGGEGGSAESEDGGGVHVVGWFGLVVVWEL